MAPQAMPRRAELRQANGPRIPVTPGSTFALGILTSSIWIMPVTEARSDIFPKMVGVESPLKLRSTRNPRTLLSVSVFAQTKQTSAIGEFVIQFLAPWRI